MVVFPNCKINLGLQILDKRPDGYHNLQTVFYPLTVRDAVEIIDNKQSPDISFFSTGLDTGSTIENNICVKAYHLVKKDFPNLPGIRMHLHKTIPSGAGLGGGSADAAFTLQLINKKYSLQLTAGQLQNYALGLGSDCPFFLINKPSYATGRGEILEEISIDLSGFKILLVNPGIHISTSDAFSRLTDKSTAVNLKDLIKEPVNKWKENILNDFEKPVFNAYPEIKNIQEEMYGSGAVYAAMSGSGSSVYGIFEKDIMPDLNFPAHYFCKWV